MDVLFIFIVGAIVGSFLSALTWRMPRKITMSGRSKCPHCGHAIRWHDNIPFFSFLLLTGRCRDCGKAIPLRDFFLETGTAFLFVATYSQIGAIRTNIEWLMFLPEAFQTIIVLSLFSLALGVMVVDAEHRYIPDTFVFLMLFIVLLVFFLTGNPKLFVFLTAGLGSGVFLLSIHILTLGRGMGLGDVKLALAIGFILGFPLSVVFLFSSFILGAIVGVVLLLARVARPKQEIAFGPFLIAGFFLSTLLGANILTFFQSYP